MKKLIGFMFFASIFSSQTAFSHEYQEPNDAHQISALYNFVVGDAHFAVNPTPIAETKATLVRSASDVKINLDSNQLQPGAYTVWLRVFNAPKLCKKGEAVKGSVCSRGVDLTPGMDPSVKDANGESTASVFWLTGAIVGEDGTIHVNTSVGLNVWPGNVVLGADTYNTPHQAIWNPLSSEIHVSLRYHGPASTLSPVFVMDSATGKMNMLNQTDLDAYSLLGRQLDHYLGNCSAQFSESMSNCSDVQIAVFPVPR